MSQLTPEPSNRFTGAGRIIAIVAMMVILLGAMILLAVTVAGWGTTPVALLLPPTETPTATAMPTPTSIPSATATPTVTPSPTATQTPTATPSPTITHTPTPTPSPTSSPTTPPTFFDVVTPADGRIFFAGRGPGFGNYINVANADGTNVRSVASYFGNEPFDVSADGRWLLRTEIAGGDRQLYVLDVAQADPLKEPDWQALTNDPLQKRSAVWSPDGAQIAFVGFMDERNLDYQLYLINADGSNLIQLPTPGLAPSDPDWSPDGEWIAFSALTVANPCGARCNWELWIMRRDGSQLTQITNDPLGDLSPDWSPDGKSIAFRSSRAMLSNSSTCPPVCGFDLYVVHLTEEMTAGEVTALTQTDDRDESEPCWSPNGRWIVFMAYPVENPGLFVMNADGSGEVQFADDQVAGSYPLWLP